MRGLRAVLPAGMALALAAPAWAGELDSKMDRIVRKLVRDSASVGVSTASLAVFPFEAEEKLAKKRVDFAVSEILTTRLLEARLFRLVERSQLEAVLKEQKLGLSGAVDSATAARIGRLVGARLAALGSVSRLGNSYQISSRLVDVETAEIVSSEVVEVAVSVFDEEASRYLVLVPERQAIGIYLATFFGSPKTQAVDPFTFSGTIGGTNYRLDIAPDAPSARQANVGLGFRYRPWRNLMTDLAVGYVTVTGTNGGTVTPIGTADGTPPYELESINLSGVAARFSANWVRPLTPRIEGVLGLGYIFVQYLSADGSEHQRDRWGSGPGTITDTVTSGGPHGNPASPFVRAGVEWRPQERLGIGLFAQHNLSDLGFDGDAEAQVGSGSSMVEHKHVLFKGDLPKTTLELTVALYF